PLGPLPPTFNKEVVRVLQDNCQKCHHDGGIGPFPLVSYEDAYAHKNDIVLMTSTRKMPPWHVASACNAFEGDPSLSAADLSTLQKWVASGAPQGDPADLPPPKTFPTTWTLGTPDMTLGMPESYRPNFNTGDIYRCFVLPTGLTEDRYVRAVEILPGA